MNLNEAADNMADNITAAIGRPAHPENVIGRLVMLIAMGATADEVLERFKAVEPAQADA
jgi:hypothetical protein